MVGFGFSEWAKPVECVCAPGRVSRSPQAPTSDATALQAVRRHVFFVAGTVPVPPLGVCQLVQRALSLAAHKMH